MKDAVRLLKAGKYTEALAAFLVLDVEAALYPELSYYLALCYTHLEKYDEAVLYLEQVVMSDLDFAHVYQSRMILGFIYAVTARYRLAEFEFTRLLEDGYESPKVYAALAYAMHAQQKVAPAIANLEKALRLDPDNANALNSLGYILADNDIRVQQAVELCSRALKRKPTNPAYLDSMGWALFKAGRRSDAKRFLQRAAEIAPENEEIESHARAVGRVAV